MCQTPAKSMHGILALVDRQVSTAKHIFRLLATSIKSLKSNRLIFPPRAVCLHTSVCAVCSSQKAVCDAMLSNINLHDLLKYTYHVY